MVDWFVSEIENELQFTKLSLDTANWMVVADDFGDEIAPNAQVMGYFGSFLCAYRIFQLDFIGIALTLVFMST